MRRETKEEEEMEAWRERKQRVEVKVGRGWGGSDGFSRLRQSGIQRRGKTATQLKKQTIWFSCLCGTSSVCRFNKADSGRRKTGRERKKTEDENKEGERRKCERQRVIEGR